MATEKTGSGAATPADKSHDTAGEATATAEAVVAPGRTVRVDTKKFRPGDTVTLPADEVERLRALGFLKPEEEPAPASGGSGGVSVTNTGSATTTKAKGAT